MCPIAHLAPYRQVLARRPFAALWAGQAISTVGDTLYNVALLWYVLGTTGSAFAAGGITVAAGLGRVLGGLGAGAVLDRLPPRRLLLATDGARLALTAAVGLPWLLGTNPPLAAVATAFHAPARAAAVPQVVPVDQLVTANALEGLSASLTNTAVWALSGAIVAALGPARALVLDAGTFLVAFLASCGRSPGPRPRPPASGHRARSLHSRRGSAQSGPPSPCVASSACCRSRLSRAAVSSPASPPSCVSTWVVVPPCTGSRVPSSGLGSSSPPGLSAPQ